MVEPLVTYLSSRSFLLTCLPEFFLQTICHTVLHDNYYMKAGSSCPSLRSLGTSPLPPEKEPPVPFLPVFPGVGWGPPNRASQPRETVIQALEQEFPLLLLEPTPPASALLLGLVFEGGVTGLICLFVLCVQHR